MKGIFVFNQINDIIFMSIDESLSKYLSRAAVEANLITVSCFLWAIISDNMSFRLYNIAVNDLL